jgi:hypothetical protein
VTQKTSRAALDSEILEWMRETPWQHDETRFDSLALRLFAHQFEACVPYARYCRSQGSVPGEVASWRDIPAVPTGAFKEVRLAGFDPASTCKIFRTSGTSIARRGELHLDTLALYETSLEASLRRFVFPDLEGGERMTIRVLAPSAQEAPDSSLSHMFDRALEIFGDESSGHDLEDTKLCVENFLAAVLRSRHANRPLAICGTAFAFVHLLDEIEERGSAGLELPTGSRVLETGGFKGRSRSMSRPDLHAMIGERFGLPGSHVLNQYGMTELGSQFYDGPLQEEGAPPGKPTPPWTRVRLIDPGSGDDVGPDRTGMIVIHDLANTGSVAAIQTADLGRFTAGSVDERFEILGREPGAEERGCSIAADSMLETGT